MERGAAHPSRSWAGCSVRQGAPEMKAVLQYRASPGLRRKLTALDFPTVVVDENDKDTFRREMREADILLHVLEPVTAAVIDAAPYLRSIQKIGIGVNTIDLDSARRRGIAVCNMPGTNTQAVVEMTLLLMLATLRRLAQLDRLIRAGKGWKFEPELPDDLGELSGRTVGLVGLAPTPVASCRCCRASARRLSTQPTAGGGLADTLSAPDRIAAGRRRALAAFAADSG